MSDARRFRGLVSGMVPILAWCWSAAGDPGVVPHTRRAAPGVEVSRPDGGDDAPAAATPRFNDDVRPLLSDRCFRCHGLDAGSREADLRLDRREDAVAQRDGNAAIVPGDPEASLVVTRIMSTDPDLQMPPPDSGAGLSAAERALLVAWIAAGAEYEPHWAFVPPEASEPPAVRDEAAIRDPADRFILARLEELGIGPEPEADPATLCRRLHFDIVGLPPTPEEVADFVADYAAAAAEPPRSGRPSPREQVYADLVDRLLASPRYGERMAGPWLDAARYADTNGYQTDGPRQMWRYRDWVIDAFNANQPFDAFTIEQLAGDLLPSPTLAQRIATGFNRNHRTNAEGGVIPEEYLVEYVVDRVETTATVWLGLTAGCARCHDHKYDPLSQRDFFRLFDFFNRVPEPGRGLRDSNSPPLLVAPTPEQEARRAALAGQAAAAQARWHALQPEVARAEAAWLSAGTPADSPGGFTSDIGLTLRLPLDQVPVGPGRSAAKAPYGRGATFDGSAPLAVADVPAFDTERPFSAAVWLRPDRERSTGSLCSSWSPVAGEGLCFAVEQGRPHVVISTRILDDVLRVEAAEPLPVGVWSHVAWSYDGGRSASGIRMLVNGRESAVRVVRDELNSAVRCGRPLVIGGGGPFPAFCGALADLRLFDRVLDAEEALAVSCSLPLEELVQRSQAGTADEAVRKKLREYFLAHAAPPDVRQAQARWVEARRAVTAFEESLPTVMVMEDVSGLRATHVLERGEYDKPRERVSAGVPEAIGLPLPDDRPPDRLALARWLVDRRNPLAARVVVNRFWQQFFGIGLVKTVEDFGLQGEPPPHRALLDWLAVDFMEHGWDVRRLIRRIVTTAAYRRSASGGPEGLASDPENRLFARGPRFRLPAEAVRDAALAVSGLLVERLGGPSVKPYQPAGLWEELSSGGARYEQDRGPDLYRRSLYIYRKRTVAVPMLATFDAAGRETCQVWSSRTNTPLQALNLLNDVAFVEAARGLGTRMIREGGSSPESRIAHGFRLVTSRTPTGEELDVLIAGFTRRRQEFAADPEAARALLAHGESPVPSDIDGVELAAFTTVGNVLLNLDEFLTRE
jgi:hypothetical protein